MIEKTTYINALFDFYQSLLTEKQRNYMEMYYAEDFSLGEISEDSKVSRQAVYDNIKRTEAILVTYEEKLGLYEKFKKRTEILDKLEQERNDMKDEEIDHAIAQLKDLD